MRRFSSSYTSNLPGDRAERKAVGLAALFAVVAALMFIAFYHSAKADKRPCITRVAVPAPPVTRADLIAKELAERDPNEKFRYIPPEFARFDFRNRSYGQYRFSSGKSDLLLSHGDYEYDLGPDGQIGWFHLSDLFFTDITGDGNPDAIVWLQHVDCGVSCDGGGALFYAYTLQGTDLKEIWRYETGSYGYGCGLKSLTVTKTQLALQMFGRCSQPQAGIAEAPGKYLVDDITVTNFHFNGSRFVKRDSDFVSASTRDVKNYQAEIHIID